MAACTPNTPPPEFVELPKGLGEYFLENQLWDDSIGKQKVDDLSFYTRYSGLLDEECLKHISIEEDGYSFSHVGMAGPQEIDQSYIYTNAAFPNERLLVSRTDVGEEYTIYLLINHTLNEKHGIRLILADFYNDNNALKIANNLPVKACGANLPVN